MNSPKDNNENPYQSPALEETTPDTGDAKLLLEIEGEGLVVREAIEKLMGQVWSVQRSGFRNPFRQPGRRIVCRIMEVSPKAALLRLVTLSLRGGTRVVVEFSVYETEELAYRQQFASSHAIVTQRDMTKWKLRLKSSKSEMINANCRSIVVKFIKNFSRLHGLTKAERSRLLRPIHDDSRAMVVGSSLIGAILGAIILLVGVVVNFEADFISFLFEKTSVLLMFLSMIMLLGGIIGATVGMLLGALIAFLWKRLT